MQVVCDIETDEIKADGSVSKVWVIVCKDIHTGTIYTFVNPDVNPIPFRRFAKGVDLWIGHNFMTFDRRWINELIKGVEIDANDVFDTLIVCRLINYGVLGGNSLDAWGTRLGFPKLEYSDWSRYTPDMLEYCIGDVNLAHKLYEWQKRFREDDEWVPVIRMEHQVQSLCEKVKDNGFLFDIYEAWEVYKEVCTQLKELQEEFSRVFKPTSSFIREICPKATKSGAISLVDFRWLDGNDLTGYSIGHPFSLFEWQIFNPGSSKQVVERLNNFGWKPTEKTKGHIKAERERNKEKIEYFKEYGWKVSETNLETLPADAPEEAHKLVKWLLLDGRRSTLEEWFNAYNHTTGRIHGTFNGIGAWTHRKSHSSPNMANTPGLNSKYNGKELKDIAFNIGKQMRSLWTVPHDQVLIGTDADGIQMRIFAHLVNDPELIAALLTGTKEEETDIHNLHYKALMPHCRSRADAKTFIYAFLLGAGIAKIGQIFGCGANAARDAKETFIERYPGLKHLKEEAIPRDARQGYFIGLDGRKVVCPSEHLMLAGYLQNAESIIMKKANLKWDQDLTEMDIPFLQVNDVHDEWQTQTKRDVLALPSNDEAQTTAHLVGRTQCLALEHVGRELDLNIPITGDYDIGTNWYETH